jgi:hypothetical protein
MRVEPGDLVRFAPWGLQYPGLGIVISRESRLVTVLDPEGRRWDLYPEQVTRTEVEDEAHTS